MLFPPFLKPQDRIGVTAPSAGIDEKDLASFDLSLSHIRAAGWQVCETPNVRTGGLESAPPAVRAAQFNSLLGDPTVRMVWCACGGDFLADMLPLVDLDALLRDPKWVQGYSDPTSLLYAITTTRDVATIYGCNAGGFDVPQLLPYMQQNFTLLSGNLSPQHSFSTFEHWANDEGTRPVFWETPHGEVSVQGRLLGGCMDCLLDILGTPYDGTAAFVKKYKEDGILWYFDIFALSAESVYRTLWHMKECGWFRHAAGVICGRVCFPNSPLGLSYRDMIQKALPGVPLVLEADVGHVPPRMTMINGALATLKAKDGKGTLILHLEEAT